MPTVAWSATLASTQRSALDVRRLAPKFGGSPGALCCWPRGESLGWSSIGARTVRDTVVELQFGHLRTRGGSRVDTSSDPSTRRCNSAIGITGTRSVDGCATGIVEGEDPETSRAPAQVTSGATLAADEAARIKMMEDRGACRASCELAPPAHVRQRLPTSQPISRAGGRWHPLLGADLAGRILLQR